MLPLLDTTARQRCLVSRASLGEKDAPSFSSLDKISSAGVQGKSRKCRETPAQKAAFKTSRILPVPLLRNCWKCAFQSFFLPCSTALPAPWPCVSLCTDTAFEVTVSSTGAGSWGLTGIFLVKGLITCTPHRSNSPLQARATNETFPLRLLKGS